MNTVVYYFANVNNAKMRHRGSTSNDKKNPFQNLIRKGFIKKEAYSY